MTEVMAPWEPPITGTDAEQLVGSLSLRRHVCDLLEEYGRHTGHADLLREAIDGRVGEDPPSDWRPTGSASAVFVLPEVG